MNTPVQNTTSTNSDRLSGQQPCDISLVQQQIGSIYREQAYLQKARHVEDQFNRCAQESNSQWLGLPLMSPSDTFIGRSFRPLSEKHASRVLTSALPEGKAVALRYEGTAPTARYAVEVLQRTGASALTCHYMQPMLRIEESSELDARHYREFTQLGIEFFTTSVTKRVENIAAMAELNIRFFQSLNLTPVFRLSHTELVSRYLSKIGVSSFAARHIAATMENAPILHIEKVLRDCGVPLQQHRTLLMLAEARNSALSDAPALFRELKLDEKVVGEFEALIACFVANGIIQYCRLDAGIYRSLNFYTGFTLQMDANGVREVAGGGEYSEMLASFGLPGGYACGSAIGLERIIELVDSHKGVEHD
jgi:histidyl-tRNA synthetase